VVDGGSCLRSQKTGLGTRRSPEFCTRNVAAAMAFWSRTRLLYSHSLLSPILESSSQPPKCDPIRASSGWMGNVTTTSPPFALPVRFVLVVEIYSELSRGEMDETGGWIAMGGIRMEKAL
jgi:hypothetical protein